MGNTPSGDGAAAASTTGKSLTRASSKRSVHSEDDDDDQSKHKSRPKSTRRPYMPKVSEEDAANNNNKQKQPHRPSPVITLEEALASLNSSDFDKEKPATDAAAGGAKSTPVRASSEQHVTPRGGGLLTKATSFRNKPLSSPKVAGSKFDNISSVLIIKAQQLKLQAGILPNLGNYDDLDTLYQDIEDDNEFEFSMNTSSATSAAAPSAVLSAVSKPPRPTTTTTTSAKMHRASQKSTKSTTSHMDDDDDDEDGEEGEDVGALKALPKKQASSSAGAAPHKRESYAAGFVKTFFPVRGGGLAVQDLLLTTYTPEMTLVKSLVLNHKKRRLLIQEVLAVKGDLATQVRFVAAVDQYEQTKDFAEQQKLAHKIRQLFFSKQSKFGIAFTADTCKRVEEDLEFLVIGRQEVLEALSKDDALLAICRAVDARKL